MFFFDVSQETLAFNDSSNCDLEPFWRLKMGALVCFASVKTPLRLTRRSPLTLNHCERSGSDVNLRTTRVGRASLYLPTCTSLQGVADAHFRSWDNVPILAATCQTLEPVRSFTYLELFPRPMFLSSELVNIFTLSAK